MVHTTETEYVDFKYPFSNPSHAEFTNFVEVTKVGYLKYLEKLKLFRDSILTEFSLDTVNLLTENHNALVSGVVEKTVNLYAPILEKSNVGIFWSGSISRHSNRLSSDFDLNFVYPDSLKDQLLPVEEQINLALSRIFNKPRDYVHSPNSSHMLKNQRLEYETSNSLVFRMQWPNSDLLKEKESICEEYSISPGLESLMKRINAAKRSPDALASHLEEFVAPDKFVYWLGDHTTVFGDEVVQPIFDRLEKKEKSLSNISGFRDDFNNIIETYKQKLCCQKLDLTNLELDKIKDIKTIYKKIPLEMSFSVMELIRRKDVLHQSSNVAGSVKINDYIVNGVSADCGVDSKLSSKFVNQFYHTFWTIIRLEAMFEKKNIRFGVHSNNIVDNTFNELYKKICPDIGDSFCKYHNNELTALYNTLGEVLDAIKF
jgi:hypothetical protein